MDDILLTYIVPVYNTEAFVLRCLQSIVEQGVGDGDYEVLVVDDGSPDNSRAFLIPVLRAALKPAFDCVIKRT